MGAEPVTRALVDRAHALTRAAMPADVRTLALQCILDTLGVMLVARDEPLRTVVERLAMPGVRRLVVVQRGTGRVEGIVSLSDVAALLFM
jgi:CBS domain-containing protein